MVTVPPDTPVTSPVDEIVAFALLVVHVPPTVASESVIVDVVFTIDTPVMAATEGAALTLTVTG